MTLFITRALRPDSPLIGWASDGGHAVLGVSLLHFEPVAFTVPEADWWFLYSSRAARFALPFLPANHAPKIACLGAGTAAYVRKQAGIEPDFCGKGQPPEVAERFVGEAAGSRVFFPRARQSRMTVQRALRDRITVLDAICYDNQAITDVPEIHADVYVFTSPLNVGAFFGHNQIRARQRVLCLGSSTGSALRAYGLTPTILEKPTENCLVAALHSPQIP